LIIFAIVSNRALKAPYPPVIDGYIEEVWFKTDPIKDFTQYWPEDGIPASESTKVYFLYDDDNLYFAFLCYDSNPERIDVQLTMRDEARGDGVSVILATFGDNRTAYWFSVNPAGVITDAFVYDDGRRWDPSWDGVWEADARIVEWGWVCEIKIPFKTLRFRENLDGWRINFLRRISRKGETDSWAPMRKNEGLRISRFGWLLGVKPKRGLYLEVYPVSYIRGEEYRYTGVLDRGRKANMGIDFNWGITPSTSIQFTFNPDFAEIEADPDEINLSKYELYFYERRPFFTERADLFTTPILLFYSRRVGKRLPDGSEVPILAGSRLTSSSRGWDLGILALLTGEKQYTDLNGRKAKEPESIFWASRIAKNFGDFMTLGLMTTGKRNSLLDLAVYGIDGTLRNPVFQMMFQLAGSEKNKLRGYAGYWDFYLTGRKFHIWAKYESYDRNFSIEEVGYVRWNGFHETFLGAGPDFYGIGPLRTLSLTVGGGALREYEDPDWGKWVSGWIEGEFHNNWGIRSSMSFKRDYEWGEWYNSRWISFKGWTDFSLPVAESLFINYTSWRYNYHIGTFAPSLEAGIFVEWKPLPPFHFSLSLKNTREYNRDRKLVASSWIFRPKVDVAVTRDILLRAYIEINTDTDIHDGNLLLSWNFRSKSWIYLAFNGSITGGSRIKWMERIGVFKVRYLFYF
jgi:hypothetical protein